MANAREERIKLTANYFNGLAIALVGLGIFSPMLSGAVNLGKIAVCLVFSGVLHLVAHQTLRRL